jgi:hypothetical protein
MVEDFGEIDRRFAGPIPVLAHPCVPGFPS